MGMFDFLYKKRSKRRPYLHYGIYPANRRHHGAPAGSTPHSSSLNQYHRNRVATYVGKDTRLDLPDHHRNHYSHRYITPSRPIATTSSNRQQRKNSATTDDYTKWMRLNKKVDNLILRYHELIDESEDVKKELQSIHEQFQDEFDSIDHRKLENNKPGKHVLEVGEGILQKLNSLFLKDDEGEDEDVPVDKTKSEKSQMHLPPSSPQPPPSEESIPKGDDQTIFRPNRSSLYLPIRSAPQVPNQSPKDNQKVATAINRNQDMPSIQEQPEQSILEQQPEREEQKSVTCHLNDDLGARKYRSHLFSPKTSPITSFEPRYPTPSKDIYQPQPNYREAYLYSPKTSPTSPAIGYPASISQPKISSPQSPPDVGYMTAKAKYAIVTNGEDDDDNLPKTSTPQFGSGNPRSYDSQLVFSNPSISPAESPSVTKTKTYLNMSTGMHSDNPVIESCLRRLDLLRPRIMHYKSDHKLKVYNNFEQEINSLMQQLNQLDCSKDALYQGEKNAALSELHNLMGALERSIECKDPECLTCNSHMYKPEIQV